MIVLSLFDGMSCGRLALQKAGIPIKKYYASEIDKYAIKVAKANFSDTIHVGDVSELIWYDKYLHKHLQPDIDLLIGGSPCQGFSFSGQRLNFDDPRSKLFFEFVRLMDETKPRWFLLENVSMKKESKDIISRYMGVEPVMINSNLVSAQNRKRLYWTNIPFTMPEDRGIMLKDIIEDKAHCLDANYFKGGNLSALKNYFEKSNQEVLIVQRPRGQNKFGYRALDGKTPTLSSNAWEQNNFLVNPETLKWRKLTPLECERLQTVPEGYTAHVSNTQRYKMLGNGWTVDVVAHIFKGLKDYARV